MTQSTDIKTDEKKDDVMDDESTMPDELILEEIVPDDLSDFSDEADEILNRQEVSNFSTTVNFHILILSDC